MIIRYLIGIVAGLTIGVVLAEALLAGAGVLVPDFGMSGLMVIDIPTDFATVGVLVPIYGLSAAFSAAMAAAVAGRSAGGVCGILWLVPVSLLGSLSGMSDVLWGSLAIACLVGSLAGTRLVVLVEGS